MSNVLKSTYNNLHKALASTAQAYSGNHNSGSVSVSAKGNKKSSSFLDDYEKRAKELKTNSGGISVPNPLKSLQSLSDGAKQNTTSNSPAISAPLLKTAKKAESSIKNKITGVLSEKYGELDTKHLFDDIDDDEIERNVPAAENTIKTNIDSGFLNRDYYAKLPNLRDGLALSYAAAEKGNSKAARKAREAAYTEITSENYIKPASAKLYSSNTSGYGQLFSDEKNDIPNSIITQNPNSGTRYVGGNGVRLREGYGLDSKTLGSLNIGDAVQYTGRKTTDKIDNHYWAEVVYNGKKYWIAADYLKTAKPETAVQNDVKSTTEKKETKAVDRGDSYNGVRFREEMSKKNSNIVPYPSHASTPPNNPTQNNYEYDYKPYIPDYEPHAVSYIMQQQGITSEHAKIKYYASKWGDVPEYKWTSEISHIG